MIANKNKSTLFCNFINIHMINIQNFGMKCIQMFPTLYKSELPFCDEFFFLLYAKFYRQISLFILIILTFLRCGLQVLMNFSVNSQ